MTLRAKSSSNGFTLVELLVVMTIIGILLAIGTAAIRNVGTGGVSTAVSQTEAFFNEARSVAIGSGNSSRVLIDVDDPNTDTYLRRMVIATQVVDENGEPVAGEWELAGGVLTLPQSVYYSQEFSYKDHQQTTGEIDTMELTGTSTEYLGTYDYYEFNAEGVCSTGVGSGGDYVAPGFVLGRGVRDEGGEPRTTAEARLDFGGFVIWRNGSTSVFRSPEQIVGASEPTTF